MVGFVVGLGEKWALLQATRDGGYPDGYVAIRIDSVKNVSEDATFEGAYARTLAQWPPTSPDGVELDGTKRLIRSLVRFAPILGIEQEGRWPDCQWIGAVVGFHQGDLGLHEVTPRATWRKRPSAHKVRRITKVVLSNGYQTALAEMAGDPPSVEGEARRSNR
ncbi:MAG: hypothetical protein ACXVDH_05855 [Nocardioides sp.]